MSEPNKRHNRKIWRSCPVCKGKVCIAQRNGSWWVYCIEDRMHIRQRFFPHAHEAIEAWNEKANKQTNADLVRAMTDDELAEMFKGPLFFNKPWCCLHEHECRYVHEEGFMKCATCLLDWLKQEVEENGTDRKELP